MTTPLRILIGWCTGSDCSLTQFLSSFRPQSVPAEYTRMLTKQLMHTRYHSKRAKLINIILKATITDALVKLMFYHELHLSSRGRHSRLQLLSELRPLLSFTSKFSLTFWAKFQGIFTKLWVRNLPVISCLERIINSNPFPNLFWKWNDDSMAITRPVQWEFTNKWFLQRLCLD